MLPSRFRPAAVPVLALLALACQDRAGPLSPERPPPRTSVVAAVCDTDADSRAHALVNGIFGPGERDAWHLRFNKGRQAAAQGRLADSWTIYAPLLAEISARALYQEAATHCQAARDYVTRDLFEKLMADEEHHIDFLETQLDLVDKLGVQLYAQHHIGEMGEGD